MPKVLVTPFEMVHRQTPGSRLLEQAGFEVVFPPVDGHLYDVERLTGALVGVDAMLAGMEPLNRNVLQGSSLRVIARFGVGYDAIDIDAARELGIAVAITPGANQVSAAEHTLALILGVFRALRQRDRSARDGTWLRAYFPRVAGKTLGLVGLGRIGKEVAPRAIALGMQVIAYDPVPDTLFASKHRIQLLSFHDLLERSDIVSLHLPCSAATDSMINRETIARMRKGAVLINTARGGLVDEPALEEALRSGHLWGAGLDAFRQEPLPTDHPLLRLDNVLVTPHTAGLDHDSVDAMGAMGAQWIVDLYRGKSIPSECWIAPKEPNEWKW